MIVESPAKARTVANILGDDYTVIASVGHVRDLPNYGYGVEDFENFKPKYVVVKDKKRGVDKTSIINDIAAAAKKATNIYLSTDPDREGEAIAWHIREAAGIPSDRAQRVVFHEITKPAIEEAFQHPGVVDMQLVDAQQARRVLDRLIGFPLTWFVQKKVSRGASAGRVQSVALGLIVKREKEILGFRAVEYWSIHAQLAKTGRPFEAELAKLPSAAKGTSLKPPFKAEGPSIANEAAAMELAATFSRSAFSVSSVKKGERSKSPVPPFTTSTFQQAANNRLGHGRAAGHGHRPGAVRRGKHPRSGPRGAHYLHANRLAEHFADRSHGGPPVRDWPVGRRVRAREGARVQHALEGCAGGARGDPADDGRAHTGEPSRRAEHGADAHLHADLAALRRQPDGRCAVQHRCCGDRSARGRNLARDVPGERSAPALPGPPGGLRGGRERRY